MIKENCTESTKYMYKYTIHTRTKTSLNVSLACFWGFLLPSGLSQNIAMLKTLVFSTPVITNQFTTVSVTTDKQGSYNNKQQNGSVVKNAIKAGVIAPAAGPHIQLL